MLTKKEVVLRWFDEVWNNGNLAAIDELFAADGIAYGLGEHGINVVGPGAFKPFVQKIRDAFPDIHIAVEQTVEEGDWIAARFSAQMTHTGGALGILPTGRRVAVSGMTMTRIANGQIVEGHNNWDIAGMMQQLHDGPMEATLLR
jgi:steroid delta-isomerase-like uncharacterized protein